MRKNIFRFFTAFILISAIISCKSLPKPISNNPTGVLAGKIEIKTNRSYWSLKEGAYNDKITVIVQNIDTKRAYSKDSSNGYFAFFNLPEGNYRLWQWRKKINVNSSITSYLRSEFKDITFTVKPQTVTTLNYIMVSCDIPKEFTYKIGYNISFKEESHEELREKLLENDSKNYYTEYKWVKNIETVLPDIIDVSRDDLIAEYLRKADVDFNSIDSLYKENEFYLSFMLFNRVITNLLTGLYINNVSEDIPDEKDLRKLAELSLMSLSAENRMFLFDITNLNNRIVSNTTDDDFIKIFNRSFFTNYYEKLKVFRTFIINEINK